MRTIFKENYTRLVIVDVPASHWLVRVLVFQFPLELSRILVLGDF